MANTKQALMWLLEGHKIRNTSVMSKNEYYVLDETKDSVIDENGDPLWSFRKGEWEIWKDPESNFVTQEQLQNALKELMSEPPFIRLMRSLTDK